LDSIGRERSISASRSDTTLKVQNKINAEVKSSFTFEDALALVGASNEVVLA